MKDKEIVLEAVKQDGYILQYLGKEFRGDRQIVLEAVKRHGMALQFASTELRRDSEIVLEAVKEDGLALKFASKEITNAREIVLTSIRQNPEAFEFVDFKLFMRIMEEKEHDAKEVSDSIKPTQSEVNDVMQEIVYVKEADYKLDKNIAVSGETRLEDR